MGFERNCKERLEERLLDDFQNLSSLHVFSFLKKKLIIKFIKNMPTAFIKKIT